MDHFSRTILSAQTSEILSEVKPAPDNFLPETNSPIILTLLPKAETLASVLDHTHGNEKADERAPYVSKQRKILDQDNHRLTLF